MLPWDASVVEGATTAVVDRLERAGHLKRVRESADRRVVHLRYDAPAMELASSFFRPLVARSHAVMDEFSADELGVILRFMRGVTAAETAAGSSVRRSGSMSANTGRAPVIMIASAE